MNNQSEEKASGAGAGLEVNRRQAPSSGDGRALSRSRLHTGGPDGTDSKYKLGTQLAGPTVETENSRLKERPGWRR